MTHWLPERHGSPMGSEFKWRHLQQSVQQILNGAVLGEPGLTAGQGTANHLGAEMGELDAK